MTPEQQERKRREEERRRRRNDDGATASWLSIITTDPGPSDNCHDPSDSGSGDFGDSGGGFDGGGSGGGGARWCGCAEYDSWEAITGSKWEFVGIGRAEDGRWVVELWEGGR